MSHIEAASVQKVLLDAGDPEGFALDPVKRGALDVLADLNAAEIDIGSSFKRTMKQLIQYDVVGKKEHEAARRVDVLLSKGCQRFNLPVSQ